jgi:hypothetical protein
LPGSEGWPPSAAVDPSLVFALGRFGDAVGEIVGALAAAVPGCLDAIDRAISQLGATSRRLEDGRGAAEGATAREERNWKQREIVFYVTHLAALRAAIRAFEESVAGRAVDAGPC